MELDLTKMGRKAKPLASVDTPDAVGQAKAVLAAQADPGEPNPSDAEFKAAVATLLLDASN